MTPDQEKIAVKATLVGVGTGLGVATAATGHSCVHLQKAGLAAPANNFAFGFTDALKHHKTLAQAFGAGGTAVVGTHAAALATAGAAAATAAFPFVIAGGAAALAGYGLFRAFKAVSGEVQQPKEGLS
jgi:hypothetical protein